MSTKHTPGPWRVTPPSMGRWKVCTESDKRIVGEASGFCLDADANARMFAAAPQLLEALREMVSLCELGDIDENTDVFGWGGAFKDAKAAIAKATGA